MQPPDRGLEIIPLGRTELQTNCHQLLPEQELGQLLNCRNDSGLSLKFDAISDRELPPPARVRLSVDLHLAGLNSHFGLSARVDPAHNFEELVEGQLTGFVVFWIAGHQGDR